MREWNRQMGLTRLGKRKIPISKIATKTLKMMRMMTQTTTRILLIIIWKVETILKIKQITVTTRTKWKKRRVNLQGRTQNPWIPKSTMKLLMRITTSKPRTAKDPIRGIYSAHDYSNVNMLLNRPLISTAWGWLVCWSQQPATQLAWWFQQGAVHWFRQGASPQSSLTWAWARAKPTRSAGGCHGPGPGLLRFQPKLWHESQVMTNNASECNFFCQNDNTPPHGYVLTLSCHDCPLIITIAH